MHWHRHVFFETAWSNRCKYVMWWLLHVLFNHTEHYKYLPVSLSISLSFSHSRNVNKHLIRSTVSTRSHSISIFQSLPVCYSHTLPHIPPLLCSSPSSLSLCLPRHVIERAHMDKRVRRGRGLKTREHNHTHAVSAFHSLPLAHPCVSHCLLTGLSITVLFPALYQNLFLSFHSLSSLFIFVYPFCQSCKTDCSFLFLSISNWPIFFFYTHANFPLTF